MKTTYSIAAGSLLLATASPWATNALAPTTNNFIGRNMATTNLGSSPRTRMFVANKNNNVDYLSINTDDNGAQRRQHTTTPNPIAYQWFDKIMSSFSETDNSNKAALAAAAMAMALTFMPLPSDAAMSGGRMGGSFSSRPAMSRPAPSSYGGGSMRRSTTYYSSPGVTVAPYAGFGYSPFFAPPVVYGGPGVVSYGRGPGLFDFIFFGGFLFVLLNIFSGMTSTASSSSSSFFDTSDYTSVLGPGTSVMKLSVAMEVPNRDDSNSILGVLGRIADTAKTDSRVGIQNLTSQVALEILRRKSSIVSASSTYQHFRDRNKAQREYQSKSVQERSKFENENVSKYGGVDYGSNKSSSSVGDGSKATMVSQAALVLGLSFAHLQATLVP